MKYSFGNTSNINIKSNNNNLSDNNNLNNNLNDIFSDFNPYDVNIFLGKQKSKKLSSYSNFQKKQTFTEYNSNLNTIYNISPISSNYKLILNNKKIEEDQLKKDLSDPKKCFFSQYQKESRRMIIEYIKTFYTSETNNNIIESIKDFLNKSSINPIILLKPEEQKKETIEKKSNSKLNYINKKPSLITLGESRLNSDNENFILMNLNNQNQSLKLMNNFLNNMDDDTPEKISLLSFLTIPRLMKMIISKEQKITFLFQATPTIISCSYGIESYIFKWSDCKNFSQIGFFDFINVDNCSLNHFDNKIFEISISSNNNMECINYLIEADNSDMAIKYINSIYFISQVIKLRAFKRKNY